MTYEEKLISVRDWKRANKARVSEWSKDYYEKNKQAIHKKVKVWADQNPFKMRCYNIRRSALLRMPGHLTSPTIQKLFEDNIKANGTLTCGLCSKPIEFGQDSLDHKTPLSRGGSHDVENLHITHRVCNKKKHNKTLEEFKS